ncbi:glycosyltransferase family 2 protein [Arthrobacter oryzae]|jgi:GT2 family glycosyltransferase|uniref:glycosyltransferase family 2 protein n=1 Tax=Arthrobacter oryzae TaxID=409290 RepID=UPI00278A0802|nr:glycosyltransferase family 2 protein [Arthrobacter oryzae]MDQ0078994.1 GT2 family glycosyltransferase [Arthrobacter oryzae]
MTRAEASRVAVVVVNFGSHHLLELNLLPVARHSPDALIVVVDNFSSMAEREAVSVQADRHGWEAVLASSNLGFGEGMNLGVERAVALGATSFLLLNPDATLDAASFDLLRKKVAAEPMSLVSPVVVRPDGSVWFAGSDLYLESGNMRSRNRRVDAADNRIEPWLSGACLMVTKELWRKLGGFSDAYFLYWEDVDLSYRTRLLGGDVVVLEGAKAVHDEGGTHELESRAKVGRGKSATYYYYNLRNRLVFASACLDEPDLRRWMRRSVQAARDVLLQGGKKQFLRPVQPLSAAFRGTWDGLQIARNELRLRRALKRRAVVLPSGEEPR